MEKVLEIGIYACIVVATILVFLILVLTFKKQDSKEKKEKLLILNKGIAEDKSGRMDRIALYLSKNGAMDNVAIKTPEQYIIAKTILTFMGLIIGISAFGNIICVFTALLGFLILDMLIAIGNSQDNKNMLPDLKNVYDTLRIQTKAGVFLSESLKNCYLVISNKRLKRAFYQLNKEISFNHDVEESVNQLAIQFNNIYIDNFIITILQSIKTGQKVNMLEDISEQMRDAESELHMIEKRKLDNKITLIAMLVFVGVSIMLVYSVYTYGIVSEFSSF